MSAAFAGPRAAATLVAAALLAAACGTGDDTADGTGGDVDGTAGGGTSAGQPGGDVVVSIAEALATPAGTTVSLEGFLIEDGGELRLAETLAESFPPQAGGRSIAVQGIDLAAVDGVRQQGPIRWLDAPVPVTGTVDDGRLVDAAIADR